MVSCPGSTPANQGVSADGIWQDHGILLTHHPHQNSRENWLWGEEGDTSASWFFPGEVAPALPAGCLVLPPGPSCSSTGPWVAPLLNRDIILNTCFLGLQVLVPNPRTCPTIKDARSCQRTCLSQSWEQKAGVGRYPEAVCLLPIQHGIQEHLPRELVNGEHVSRLLVHTRPLDAVDDAAQLLLVRLDLQV